MKLLLIFVGTVFSGAAISCPDLTGEYQCYDDIFGDYLVTMSQTGQGNSTIYRSESIDGVESMIADNQWRQVYSEFKEKAFCQGKTFNTVAEEPVIGGGIVLVNTEYSINNNLDLVKVNTITYNNQTVPVEVNTCTRL